MKKNIIANLLGRVWGFISVYLFIPLYLKFLGIEAYGLVGFYSTLLGILVFADMGFTATLTRELARLSVRKDSAEEMKDLLRTYESAYLCISTLIVVVIWIFAPLIAEHWLRANKLSSAEITIAIRLMGISIALQLPSGLYCGGLIGLQKQVLVNIVQILWGIFRGVGAVLVIWLISPTIFSFALWQLISNAIYCFFVRFILWRVLSTGTAQSRPQFRWQVFSNTWRYAVGMFVMSLISTLLLQTDKVVISKVLSLEMLGYYTLAWTLASVPVMLSRPIVTAIFPRLTGLVALDDHTGLVRLYHKTNKLIAVAIIPIGLTIAFFAGEFIYTWTGSIITAHKAGLVASLLIYGQLMQAITVVPYYTALAHGNVKLNLQIGICSVIVITPLLIFLIIKFGVVGAGISWLIMNLCTLPPYMYFLHRRFVPGELWKWVLCDMGHPVLAVLPIVLLGRWLMPSACSRLFTFFLIGLVWSLSSAAAAVTMPELRTEFIKRTGKLFGACYGI